MWKRTNQMTLAPLLVFFGVFNKFKIKFSLNCRQTRRCSNSGRTRSRESVSVFCIFLELSCMQQAGATVAPQNWVTLLSTANSPAVCLLCMTACLSDSLSQWLCLCSFAHWHLNYVGAIRVLFFYFGPRKMPPKQHFWCSTIELTRRWCYRQWVIKVWGFSS